MDSEKLAKILADHAKWLNGEGGTCANLRRAYLQGAYLQGAYLQGADLQGANLQGANLDFAAWPLWCGAIGVIVDARLAAQLAGHGAVVNVEFSDDDSDEVCAAVAEWQAACHKLGAFSHRAKELGLLPAT